MSLVGGRASTVVTTGFVGLVLLVAVPVVKAAARVISICVALHGVKPPDRAEVLLALAEVHRWWRWRR